MRAEQLYGIWELTECYGEFENGDGTRLYPYGEDAIGRLTYHAEGYMSAFLSSIHRSALTTDLADVPDSEAKRALTSFDAYGGTFTLDLERSVVTHHVTMARIPNWVGTDQVRYFTLENEVLKIRSAPITYAGKSLIVYANWKRLV
jgi:hypothetical protein